VSLTKIYELTIGDHEIHEVRIEKDRALVLAGARRQLIRAYVDDVLTAEGVA
jgi:Pyruvate/2-oxoacid:ferredoxin oxidoreductase gamma subunit